MRRIPALCLAGLLLTGTVPAWAGSVVTVCYNYGCLASAEVDFSPEVLGPLQWRLAQAQDGAQERAILAEAMGTLYRAAGRQLPIWRDQPGDYLDDAVEGRMDCIDHAQTTTAFLQLLQAQGWLRFHAVGTPVRRRFLIFQHFSAALLELGTDAVWVIDTWFGEHGAPALVFPLDEWKDGAGPNVS